MASVRGSAEGGRGAGGRVIILAVIEVSANDDQSSRDYSGRRNENRNDRKVLAGNSDNGKKNDGGARGREIRLMTVILITAIEAAMTVA